jgi:phosphatidylserine decarboxylase
MIAKGGRVFVACSAAAAMVALLADARLAAGLAVLAGLFAFAFRDPRRTVGDDIVAPADGRVRDVDHGKGLVSTYLALRNVHVTRAPIEGVVEKSERMKGRHSPAFSSRGEHNERMMILLRTKLGEISIVQMTGAIARRIVPYVSEGQVLSKGDKLSLIRFGSRVDIYLPARSVRILVERGDRLRAGVTRIAEVSDGDLD